MFIGTLLTQIDILPDLKAAQKLTPVILKSTIYGFV
jgi:hypothetical protein